jgi:hypothetical protein
MNPGDNLPDDIGPIVSLEQHGHSGSRALHAGIAWADWRKLDLLGEGGASMAASLEVGGWRAELEQLLARFGRLFVRAEPRQQAGRYLEGLLGPVKRKTRTAGRWY